MIYIFSTFPNLWY